MKKKVMVILSLLLVVLLLGGCWNYRGLNTMSIVTGVAFDREEATGGYKITFEIVDMTGNVKTEGIKPLILETTGATLFDAIREAKRRIVNSLYLGHMETVILSEQIAREEDLSDIIDFLTRHSEVRETLVLVISQEHKASDLIKIDGIGNPLVSYDIQKIIMEDYQVAASTSFEQLYTVHEILHTEGIELALPAFHNVDNNGKTVTEANGIAVYKGERLIGFLTSGQSKYYLFAVDKIKGGVLTFSSCGEDCADTSLEIDKNKTERSFAYTDGQLVVTLKVDADTYLNESDVPLNSLEEARINELESLAAAQLKQDMASTIETIQKKYQSDILGFGDMIHKKDPKLWDMLKSEWDTLFPKIEVKIECKVNIANTANIKE